MLLSTPRSVPPTSGVMLKRGAKKFFDIGQAQGWIVRVKADDRYDNVAIELWDWERATIADLPRNTRSNRVVRLVGTFDATSGAYHGQGVWGVNEYGTSRYVSHQGVYEEKLQDLIQRAEKGPNWKAEQDRLEAQRNAEAEARKLRRSAMEASVRAKGDSPLAMMTRNRLDQWAKNTTAPDLAATGERYAAEKVLDWRINLRLASHVLAARKLIHTFVGTSGDERFLNVEEAVVLYADRLLKEMVEKMISRYGGYEEHQQKADAKFVTEFHPKWSASMRDVFIVREA
jgi:hypothetical protein